MKWTKEERQAIKDSITHWENDVVKPLKRGHKIIRNDDGLVWEDTLIPVKYAADDCALCVYTESRDNHSECPYVKFYGVDCDDNKWEIVKEGHWRTFVINPNLKTAQAMVRALKRMLK